MTSRERLLAMREGELPDRVPRRAGFTPDLRRKVEEAAGTEDLEKFFDMDSFFHVGLRRPPDLPWPDYSVYYPDLEDKGVINEIGVARVSGDFYHFTHIVSPLRNAETLDEIEAFPIDENEKWTEAGMAEDVRRAHEEGKIVAGSVTHLYEEAWQIRGLEQFLEDLVLRPDFAESILERLTRRNVRRARAAAKAGADLLYTGDDIAHQHGMIFSPELWRRFLKPRWARIYEAAKEIKPDIMIWYHSDGNVSEVLDDLVEIGVEILNPVQPECMDLLWVKRRYGSRLVLDGTMGTQTTFPFGTPEEMESTVRERVEALGYDGRLMLAPTHVLEPEVPVENVFAFFRACDRHGRLR